MAQNSTIEWTEKTWNPITGCTKISPGCDNCYAERMTRRLHAMGSPNYRNGFNLTCHPHSLTIPYQWKKNCTVFVNSMSDLFHKETPISFITDVFNVMNDLPLHQFQVLTKRSKRLKSIDAKLQWASNIWMGVSVENQDFSYRIENLLQTSAHVKFLSLEPLIGPLDNLKLNGIDWVIVGGESGPGARPMEPEWVTKIQQTCTKSNTPFFFKQWGGVRKKKTGRLLNGKLWDQMPKIPIVSPKSQPAMV